MEDKKLKINVIGSVFAGDGYSSHTTQLCRALYKLEQQKGDIEVCISTQRPQGFERGLDDDMFKMLTRNPQDSDVNLIIAMPHQAATMLEYNKKNIIFVVWEGSKIPSNWVELLSDERINQIWVPSTHTKEAILNTLNINYDINLKRLCIPDKFKIVQKIKIVPHGVDLSKFFPNENTNKAKEFTFITAGGWPRGCLDRKGISFLIKAYMEEFTNKDNVKLIVKLNAAYGVSKEMIDLNMYQLGISPERMNSLPKFEFITQNVDYKDLNKFYNLGDVFVSTSLAEGYNLGCIEAQACGIPVITTTYGGMKDFCSDKTGWLLEDGKMIDVTWDMMYSEVKWKVPNIDEIKKTMRYVFNNQDKVISKKKECLENASKNTWDNTASIAYLNLKEL